ncbi:UDP-N-acetylmuramoyl-L-alanyl-D-glutamate--2,6-diaminopimelate ligase [Geobacter sp. SVR]|uniref:UDP-N-acetylmuramoyl-L-alanyl-D-glutamate--2, 6-diaminopimelate ligase n=1 Tax=Geobacter sp. SVR TaxID=2495594 RepID=UPI00143EFF75|nr:UDP-N-acetylmuramoyl-L-alanyl-D-glutamate--2,6-diaminopimelate ligase [Geobacter sp. SVR]BCS52290.1 UDP-N-acetylmuramoyl-L-alanyl-D-glutamate--2,6-diaminopimelate ligase [Geobacter sp. SVR]GCF85051.1 UDP-N-acetylmuramoyl-L-alanyl-D-glutamate--2,6-diaminopimelate ligase [Geobacter sp. SVR]
MTLSQLLSPLADCELHGQGVPEISGVTCDSRGVAPGSLFFALRGTSFDGHNYVAAAVEAGAAAVVLEDPSFAPATIPWVRVPDGRAAMAAISAEFYGNPTAGLPLVGITGTNGKTTTTYLLEGILTAAGLPPAVLGTISYRFGDTSIEASHTTPESTELQAAFRTLDNAGARAFVMEVSSHALEQKRVDGCHFDVGVFTNLTRDHLDYHKTMESYLDSKLRLFRELLRTAPVKPQRRAAVNMDDEYGARVAAAAVCPVITYGVDFAGDVRAANVTSSVSGISGTLVTPAGEIPFESRLLGKFNLSNILAAAAAGIALDLPLEAIKTGIEQHATVPGRMERVDNSHGVTLLVDYAHTGDALENVLSTLQELKTGRIITVFGCGGDRDPGKRPIMGSIAARMSDIAIVTSDNPRTEDPFAILDQVRAGIVPLRLCEFSPDQIDAGGVEKGFTMLENRREAIRLAVRLARPGDIVLLAGKGHEDYQIIGRTKHHFDDREEARQAFAELLP